MAETIKGLNIKLGLDTTELEHNLKEITKELKEEQKDLKAINNALKFDSGNLDLWKEKQDKLNSILETTKKKLETQNAKLEEAKKAVQIGAISEEEFNSLKRSVQYTEADISKLNKELETTNDKIKSLGSINLNQLNKIGTNLSKYVTAPILGAVSALGVLTKKTMDSAGEIADNAAKVYLATDAYQKWTYAFKLLGAEESSMRNAFIKLNTLLGDIAQGNGEKYEESLKKIGLSTEELIGLTPDEAFGKIRDSLSELEDETLRVAIANEIFGGKIGAELAQVIGATSNEISALKLEVEELGIITEDEISTAKGYKDSLDRLKQSAQSLAMQLSVAFVPVLNKVNDLLQNKLIPAAQRIIAWWNNLSSATRKIIAVVVGLVAALGPVLVTLAKVIPLVSKMKSVLSGLKLGGAIQGLSLGKVAIIGLIAALAVLLLKNEKFQEVLKTLVSSLQKVLAPIGELIGKLVSSLAPLLETIANGLTEIIDALVGLIEKIIPPLISILEAVVEIVKVVLEVIIDLVKKILPPLISIIDVIVEVIVALIPIIELVINLIANVLTKVIQVLLKILEPIKTILFLIVNVIGVLFTALTSIITSILKPLIKIIEVVFSVLSIVVDVVLKIIDILVAILIPIIEIIIAVLNPVLSLIGTIIGAIGSLMGVLSPLIDLLLAPLIGQLDFIKMLLELFSPLLSTIGDIISAILVPAIEILATVLEPVLWLLQKIIDAISWIIDNVAKAFEGIGGFFKKVGNFFGDLFSGRLFQSNKNETRNAYTTNNVVVNTSSSSFDIDSINKALGGAY
ncbi:MAG TPA: hypothetical protein PLH44_04015 [Bacilli bacterium]|nr:hypothetical protein [Bacilli bacterium]